MACQSLPSNTSIRTRQRSKTSSEGDDSLPANKSYRLVLEDKPKPRATKCPVTKLPRNLRATKKGQKTSKVGKPNAGSLQNAVVLAPFYTLKKCFQNKLVDLYSQEKMKNINNKTQMAKKKNMSFEYDILELKPLDSNVKKEGKSTKKPKPKSRSASYCQCKRIPSKDDRRGLFESSPRKKRQPSRSELFSAGFSEQLMTKRRKLNHGIHTPTDMKNDVAHRYDFYIPQEQLAYGEAHQGSSAMSSLSKCESWDTHSTQPSCKEERVHGSLAISNTSFDSYLEHFDKGSWGCSEPSRKCNSRMQKVRDPDEDSDPDPDPDILPKSTAKNLFLNAEMKNSDGEIVDFMDREPQTSVIPSVDSNQQWKPLRRPSKTKRKKTETNAAAGYYLRSCSRDKEGSRMSLSKECKSPSRIKIIQVEVGTQVGEISGQDMQLNRSPPGSAKDTLCRSTLREQTPEDFRLPASPPEPPGDLQSPRGSPQPPLEGEGQPGERLGGEERLGLPVEDSGLGAVALLPGGFPEGFEGSPGDSQEPEDKEYIFGARSNAGGLGESCEFSFGLKWVLSDDED